MLSVKLFARARDLAGSPIIQIPWSDGLTVASLKQRLGELHPAVLPLVPRLLVAVNNDYAGDSTIVKVTDEVACFPPVSGG
ncbi:MAG: MoaD/ThiS family protein [Planctomycetes bacterium]|nr:MoaD/ThiS family protein [Planctomycetota bacterium]